jgi:hypothetical protein
MSRHRNRDRCQPIQGSASPATRAGAAGDRPPASGETTAPGTGPAGVPITPHRGAIRDPLADLQALVAEYGAASARERNYGSSRFADLFYWAVKELLPEPLPAGRAAQIEEILRRAEYGPGPARALAGSRPRHLRAVDAVTATGYSGREGNPEPVTNAGQRPTSTVTLRPVTGGE